MELMTTSEVADYLRIGERKVYQLVGNDALPRLRVGGKLLFPRASIDQWLTRHIEGGGRALAVPPAVLVGSEDVLLDWAVRESDCGLAVLYVGSMRGIRRLVDGEAMVAGLHLIDAATGEYNVPARCGLGEMGDLVLIEWARRRQGLLLAPGNPLGIRGLADVPAAGGRFMRRQGGAGAEALLQYRLGEEGVPADRIDYLEQPALSETDLAAAIATGRADCGVGIEAVAHSHGLDFLPLQEERFDLALRRRDYFEPLVQRLLAFTREPRFQAMAAELSGYDIAATGRVVYNA